MANKPMISVFGGKIQTLAATDVGIIEGGLFIGKNLEVAGDIISGGSQNVVIKDQFIDLGVGATSTAQNTGLTFSVKEGSVSTTFTDINASTGVVSTASNAGFAIGDIIVITNSDDAGNDGLYAISSIDVPGAKNITIEAVAQPNAPFIQTAFSTSTSGESGNLTKVDLAAISISNGSLPAVGGGTIPVGKTASAYYPDATLSDFNSTGYNAMETSLQEAYNEGSTIVIDNAGPGVLAFDATNAGVDTFQVGASTKLGFISLNADSALLKGTNNTPGSAKVDVVSGGTVRITENDANGLEIGATSTAFVGTMGTITRDSGSLTLETTTSGSIRVEAAEAFTVGSSTPVSTIGMNTTGAYSSLSGESSDITVGGNDDATPVTLSLEVQNSGTEAAILQQTAGDVIKFLIGSGPGVSEELAISSANSVFNNRIEASSADGFQFGTNGQNMTAVTTDLTSSALISDIASASAIVSYVDGAVAGVTLAGSGDSGTYSVVLDTDSFEIAGGTNINTVAAGTALTVNLNDAITVATSVSTPLLRAGEIRSDVAASQLALTIDGVGNVFAAQQLQVFGTLTAQSDFVLGGQGVDEISIDGTFGTAADDQLATALAIKTYVDSQVTAQDLDGAGDVGAFTVDLDSQSFSVLGGTNINTAGDNAQALTVNLDDAIFVATSVRSPLVGTAQITDSAGTTNAMLIGAGTGDVQVVSSLSLSTGTSVDAISTDGTFASPAATDDQLATALAIKTYVDTQDAAQSLSGTGDSGSFAVNLASDSLGVQGGGNITTAAGGTSVTVALNAVVDVATSLTVGSTVVVDTFIDEDDMASDSDTALPTQQSVKAYVDTRGNSNYLTTLELESDVAIAAGSVVAIDSAGKAILADANAAGATNVIGLALNATTGTPAEQIAIAQFGALGGVPGTYANGDQLYLSTTAGQVTNNPPSGQGETIYRIGTAVPGPSGSVVAISLQFIAEVL